MKNPTPKQIVFRSALLISLLYCVLSLLPFLFPQLNYIFYYTIILTAAIFVISYFVFFRFLEAFIYRKIKLIYKNIHDLKSTRKLTSQTVDLQKDIISEVNEQVVNWANERNSEIEQLKKLEIYRREFLGNVSHELKTPITSILGYLETLSDGGINDPDISTDYLNKAIRNVERMISTIDNLESIANLESGELQLKEIPFDINDLTKQVLIDIELPARQRNISMVIKEGCDKTFTVMADKNLIRDVLTNLLINSIKYGKPEGKTSIGYYNMGENVLVEVSDNGVGISKENLNRVFERFYRVEKSRSREFGGTGLGLSIVKHIIEAHNQTVSARSTIHQGSTFGFTLKKA
ncbi:MAG: sensor histidine kinase [Bacteroidetes bacterium]|nr:sensor histidine kinase [Bacteroidota bacterium]